MTLNEKVPLRLSAYPLIKKRYSLPAINLYDNLKLKFSPSSSSLCKTLFPLYNTPYVSAEPVDSNVYVPVSEGVNLNQKCLPTYKVLLYVVFNDNVVYDEELGKTVKEHRLEELMFPDTVLQVMYTIPVLNAETIPVLALMLAMELLLDVHVTALLFAFDGKTVAIRPEYVVPLSVDAELGDIDTELGIIIYVIVKQGL